MRGPIIFVVGTGRSGTHFLARSLIAHPQVTDLTGGRENPFVFETAVRLATGRARPGDSKALVLKYKILQLRARGRVLIDQSHPNLWNYGLLAPAFPSSAWIGLVRDPRAVVASMLVHSGVRARTERWKDYPLPNDFLGVTEANRSAYEVASVTARCAYRWLSHGRRILELSRIGAIVPMSYEKLVRDPDSTIGAVWDLMGIQEWRSAVFDADESTLSKWKDALTTGQVKEILAIAESDGTWTALQDLDFV